MQPGALSFLHTDTFVPHANVMENLNLGHSLYELIELGESYSTTQKVKIFAGYAGWSAGQLDDEMKRDAWLAHPATVELVFDANPSGIWKAILAKKGWQYRLMSDGPEDLGWN